MAFVTVNGFDVEHASQLQVYDNLWQEIQHINGKGVIDTYTKTDDVRSVRFIDVLRVLSYVPRFRKLGSANNGAFHNEMNIGGYNNSPQSEHYTIPVDLMYDEGIQISSAQIYSNPVELEQVITKQLIKVAGMSINIITFAKQIEAFFRQGDNFDKKMAGTPSAIIGSNIAQDEIDEAVFFYDRALPAADANSAPEAFMSANGSFNDGIPEIGAYTVPADERQAFVTTKLHNAIKRQYAQNASEASARILATGFVNPFNDREQARINTSTGLLGMYDGVDIFLFNKVTRDFTYVALGVLGTTSDSGGNLPTVRGLLDQIGGFIVYGAGTCRGIVGPTVEANKNPFFGGVYILPQMKVGVEVLHGATIKMLVDAGASLANAWTTENIAMIMNTIVFTPIDGKKVKGNDVVAGFNDGTTN